MADLPTSPDGLCAGAGAIAAFSGALHFGQLGSFVFSTQTMQVFFPLGSLLNSAFGAGGGAGGFIAGGGAGASPHPAAAAIDRMRARRFMAFSSGGSGGIRSAPHVLQDGPR